MICEAFADNQCIYVDVSYNDTGCEGILEETETVNMYYKCCDASTEKCNYEDISLDNCVESTAYKEFVSTLFDCRWGTYSVHENYPCDMEFPSSESDCDELFLEYNQASYQCYCSAYKLIYDRLSPESKALMQDYIDKELNMQLEGYNGVIDCGANLACNLTTGQVTNDPTGNDANCRVYLFAFVSRLFVYILC